MCNTSIVYEYESYRRYNINIYIVFLNTTNTSVRSEFSVRLFYNIFYILYSVNFCILDIDLKNIDITSIIDIINITDITNIDL